MKKVLVTQRIHQAGLELLEGKAEVIISPDPSGETIKKLVGDVHGILLRTTSKITRDVILAAQTLEVISRTGAGVDNIDVAAATERGIKVCNLPGINTASVAEHAVVLIAALAKDIVQMDAAVRQGNWNYRSAYRATELEGKLLGLVGLGRIGRRVAEICRGLGMRILAYDPYLQTPDKQMSDIELCPDFEQLFTEADFISVHVPYNEVTHHLVRAKLLRAMKKDAYLVNTSRGAVVDQRSLIEVLQKGHIAGAALDVFEEEPPSPDNPLLQMDNVILSPHSAALTKDCAVRAATGAVKAILAVFDGKEPENVFNRESLGNKAQS